MANMFPFFYFLETISVNFSGYFDNSTQSPAPENTTPLESSRSEYIFSPVAFPSLISVGHSLWLPEYYPLLLGEILFTPWLISGK